MFIYGGIDDNKNYLSDMWILDLFNFIWLRIDPRTNIKTPAVAYHSSCMAYGTEKKEHSNFKIFSQNEVTLSKNAKKVRISF